VSLNRSNHIIQKQSIEIDFAENSNGFSLQNDIAELFYERLLPRMEMLFDEFGNDDYLISFETLELDCGVLPSKHWEEAWVEETLKALRKELLAANKIKISAESAGRKTEDALIFFLNHGYLPWNSAVISIKELELVPDKQLVEKLKGLFQSQPATVDRLVNNFSGEFLHTIIQSLADGTRVDITEGWAIINTETSVQQRKKMQSHLIKKICTEKLEDASKPVATNQPNIAKKISTTETEDQEGIYIHNAGLVILHPFLPELFKTLDLFGENGWKDEISSHTAILVVEYLVTGSDECPEFNLPLNKIICGMEPGEVLKTVEPLTMEIKAECDKVLQAVIQHWTALKNTGIDALRETYLQRFGKLTKVDHGWSLQVEPKVMDVLLGRLPWGIGTIRLPWMKGMLFTEWY
jgi:hypothetical protein